MSSINDTMDLMELLEEKIDSLKRQEKEIKSEIVRKVLDVISKEGKEEFIEVKQILDLGNIPLGYDTFPKDFYASHDWAIMRIYILKRDDYRCTHCYLLANHVDHINSARYNPIICLDPNNLISTCKKCHDERHGNYRVKK